MATAINLAWQIQEANNKRQSLLYKKRIIVADIEALDHKIKMMQAEQRGLFEKANLERHEKGMKVEEPVMAATKEGE